MKPPFFSIITISFRAEDTIAKTIQSALNQDFSDFEIIVKDGLSDDETLNRIPENSKIRVYSQKDLGIYDAMNQATALASGEYLIYMNCGDYFADPTVLSQAYQSLKDKSVSMAYGDYIREGIYHKQPTVLTPFYLYRTPLCHQSIFFKRPDLVDFGAYDTGYRILGDYDAEMKFMLSGKKIIHLDFAVCKYLGGGVSESTAGIEKKRVEREKIIARYYSSVDRKKYAVKLALSLPKFRQWLVSDQSPKWITKIYQRMVNLVNR